MREEIAQGIRAINGPRGEAINNVVLKPDEIYHKALGVPPDLMVYPDDLDWRAIGSVGHDSIYADENDTGPDDANHDYNGVFVCSDKALTAPTKVTQIAPLLLSHFGVNLPA
ncbi:MAG: hypothetical protein IT367_20925 [Candidatus Hydrogenedentes bacterium]|nr:hypothetical protein [Candidatus Hydrogenedentota bacterium]